MRGVTSFEARAGAPAALLDAGGSRRRSRTGCRSSRSPAGRAARRGLRCPGEQPARDPRRRARRRARPAVGRRRLRPALFARDAHRWRPCVVSRTTRGAERIADRIVRVRDRRAPRRMRARGRRSGLAALPAQLRQRLGSDDERRPTRVTPVVLGPAGDGERGVTGPSPWIRAGPRPAEASPRGAGRGCRPVTAWQRVSPALGLSSAHRAVRACGLPAKRGILRTLAGLRVHAGGPRHRHRATGTSANPRRSGPYRARADGWRTQSEGGGLAGAWTPRRTSPSGAASAAWADARHAAEGLAALRLRPVLELVRCATSPSGGAAGRDSRAEPRAPSAGAEDASRGWTRRSRGCTWRALFLAQPGVHAIVCRPRASPV